MERNAVCYGRPGKMAKNETLPASLTTQSIKPPITRSGPSGLIEFNTYQIFAARYSANSGEINMAFVNEYVSPEDVRKYDLEGIKRRFGKDPDIRYQWRIAA